MQESLLVSLFLPIILIFIMLGLGLTLVPKDFGRVFQYPKAVGLGLFHQLFLLPIIGFLIATSLNLSPTFAVGMMILSVCPGGIPSNLMTLVARGDTALSITLTAISSTISIISIPIIISATLLYFIGDATIIQLPIGTTILRLFFITLLPVAIGMLIRAYYPTFAIRLEKPIRKFATIIFILMVLAIIYENRAIVVSSYAQLGMATLLLNLIGIICGFLSAYLFKLKLNQAITLALEIGMQNCALAILIATTILHQGDMALPAAIYTINMFFTGGIIMYYFGNKRRVF